MLSTLIIMEACAKWKFIEMTKQLIEKCGTSKQTPIITQ